MKILRKNGYFSQGCFVISMTPVRRIRVTRARSVTLALSTGPSPAPAPPDTKDWTAPRTLTSAHKV